MDDKSQRRGRRLSDEQVRHADLDPGADRSLIVVGSQKNGEQFAKDGGRERARLTLRAREPSQPATYWDDSRD